jgi:23S rRNA pseudouridine2604 synthase
MGIRINKFLSQRGYCSRREADKLIEAGKVRINGRRAELGDAVEPDDEVIVLGKQYLEQPDHLYIMFNKPVGVITTNDQTKQDNVISVLGLKERVFPVGRLDVESSGLLLLTNDGDLAARLTHPKFGHEKEYEVKVAGEITEEQINKMRKGVRVDGRRTKPARIRRMGPNRFGIMIKEGRNRQIRKMAAAAGAHVLALKRIRIHTLKLGRLPVGRWRELTKDELKALQA